MKLVRVGAAALNQTPLDWQSNKKNIIDTIELAIKNKVNILCLPELCITGYGCEDMFHSIELQEKAGSILIEIVNSCKDIIVSVGLPLLHNGALYNVACLIQNQSILGFVPKQFLAGDGIHYEPRWFKAWPKGISETHKFYDQKYDIGDIFFNCKLNMDDDIKIGFEICEDAWVGNRPGSVLSRKGIDIILNPSASHFAFGKHDIRKRFVLEGSRAFNVSYVYANLLGNESGRAIYDGDTLIASNGTMLAMGKRFSYQNFELTEAVIDVDLTRTSKVRTVSFNPDFAKDSAKMVESNKTFKNFEIDEYINVLTEESWEKSSFIKEEEFTRAISLGLFDYLRKSHSNGFVISLSGGADSAACACLVRTMISLAHLSLEMKDILNKLNIKEDIKLPVAEYVIVNKILTCVYQGTENSSDTTFNAAQKLSENIGAKFLNFNIDQIYKSYVKMIEQAIGENISWETSDLALQNIQARTRSPGVWMIANIKNALLICTSNRSETALGFCTLDGDTSGGLSPIAGIDKNFLRKWLVWMETQGPDRLYMIPSLKLINEQQPTAELRPPSANQTDEKDLMPYDVLDAIEKCSVRDKKFPLSTFKTIKNISVFKKYSNEELCIWVIKFFKLWSKNQWKRERYAPSFHVDDENLDPKSWCRFPILSGGFEEELKELQSLL